MGNVISSSLLSNVGKGGNDPYCVQLGNHVSMLFSGRNVLREMDGVFLEWWTVSYGVGCSDCQLQLWRRMVNGDVKALVLKLHSVSTKLDGTVTNFNFLLDVATVAGTDAVVYPQWGAVIGDRTKTFFNQSKTTHQDGSITITETYLYGVGHKGGLLVLESKKHNSTNLLPYALTVTHYHATAAGINNEYPRSKPDFGLSVVARVRPLNGNVAVSVEGPEQHPSSALFYLFEQVKSTGIWKPTMCPHCAQIPRQRSTKMLSEDEETSDDVRESPRNAGHPNAARLISNGGKFGGDGNGNFYEGNTFNLFNNY